MTHRRNISSGGAYEPVMGYSRAVRVGDTVHVSGTTAALPEGGTVGAGDVGEQTREVLRRIETALGAAGATLADVVRTRVYVTDISTWREVAAVHGERFTDIRPAASMVEVSRLIAPDLLVEIEADAVVRGPGDR